MAKQFLSDETIAGFQSGKESSTGVERSVPSLKKHEIVYEDKHILIANKPVGELSQKAKKDDISINERIVEYLRTTKESGKEYFTPGVCNRLDRNTTGLIIAGKSLAGLQEMAELLRNRTLHKYYLCVVMGEAGERKKLVGYLKKDTDNNTVKVLTEKAMEQCGDDKAEYDRIETELIPLLCKEGYSLLAIQLITGKTHQSVHIWQALDCRFWETANIPGQKNFWRRTGGFT